MKRGSKVTGFSPKTSRAILLIDIAFTLCVPPAPAQSDIDGGIAGRILTSAGGPVANAHIIVRSTDTGLEADTHSTPRGDFLIPRIPVGEYTITLDHSHTQLTLPDPVTVGLGQVTETSIQLQSAAAQPLADTDSPPTNDLAVTQLAALPINDGDWDALALTVPGANSAASDNSDADTQSISFRGIPSNQNSSRIDGASDDENFSGSRLGTGVAEEPDSGADAVYDPAAGAGSGSKSVADGGQRAGSSSSFTTAGVREFRVQGQSDAASYGSALYGHGVGGVTSTVSRSGSQSLHAMLFYNLRDSAFDAANPFDIASTYVNGLITNTLVKPHDLRQQFGGSAGGPLSHRTQSSPSRLFFFYAFDEQLRNFPAISSPGYAGFYALTPTQSALLANRGVTPTAINTALNYLDSLTGTVPRTATQLVNFGRLDWHHARNSAILEFNDTRWNSPAGARSAAVVDRAVTSLGSTNGAVDSGVLRVVSFLRPSLINTVRFQFGHELLYETAQPPQSQEPNIGPDGFPPEVSIGPQGFVFGTPASLGRKAYPDERRIELADDLAWTHHRHLIQLGADLSTIADTTDSLANIDGTFSYDSGATHGKAGGLVDWITDYTFNVHAYPNGGCPSIVAAVHDFCFRSYSQSFGQQVVSFNTRQLAAFAQDDIRLSERLTLHAGIRYELALLPTPQQPNPTLDAAFGSIGATSFFPEDRNNFGPRLGVEWSPFGSGHLLIRAGYGVYYGKLPGATIRAALINTAQPNSVTRIRILPTTETACPQITTVGFGYPCSFLALPTGVAPATTTTSAMVFDRRFRLPLVQQGTASMEREIGAGIFGSALYVINLDRQLPDSVDINIAPSPTFKEFQLQGGTGLIGARDGEIFYVPGYGTRINRNFGPVTDIVSHANASYNGLTLQARRGLGPFRSGGSRSFDFRLAWTWSKAIDFGQNSAASPRSNSQFDPFNIRYDKGLSALNFPHRVVATAVWSPRGIDPPGTEVAATAERTIWRLANGLSIAAIFSESSGRGYSYDVFGGTRLAGGRESINGSGGSAVLPTVGRNILRLPDSTNLDLRLTRSFRLSESLRLRASLEAFNALNHVNYSGITQRAYLAGTPVSGITPLVFQDAPTVAAEGLNVQPFGAYTASGINESRGRQLQLGLKLEF